MTTQRIERIARIYAASLLKHHNFNSKNPELDKEIRVQVDKIAEAMRKKSGVKSFKTSLKECIEAVPEDEAD